MREQSRMSGQSFMDQVNSVLAELGEDMLKYDQDEFWMIKRPYCYLEYIARENQFYNTALALPIARAIHDGSHRKSSITKGGKSYRLPYVIHCLLVCRMLVDLDLPLSHEEKDIVFAAALCHDMIEDIPFPEHGKELISVYHLDPRVYETVLCVSKRKDFTDEEHQNYFNNIQANKLALLVKLSDRGNNVEDLYNMKVWKVHEYVGETNTYFLPMGDYGKEHYKELYRPIDILLDKINNLTELAETFVNRYDAQETAMLHQVEELREENDRLWKELKSLQDLAESKGGEA